MAQAKTKNALIAGYFSKHGDFNATVNPESERSVYCWSSWWLCRIYCLQRNFRPSKKEYGLAHDHSRRIYFFNNVKCFLGLAVTLRHASKVVVVFILGLQKGLLTRTSVTANEEGKGNVHTFRRTP